MEKRKKMNIGKLIQKAKESKTGGISYLNGVSNKRFRLVKGKNRISVIPFEVTTEKNMDGVVPGELWYKATVLVHAQIGVNKQMVICPKMFNKKCPICEAEKELAEQGVEWNDESRMALRAKKRELYNVVNDAAPEDGVQVFETSYGNFGKKLDAEIEDDEENGRFPDADEGLIIVARGQEESFGKAKYISVDKISFEEREPLTDEVLNAAVDFNAHLKVLSYDEIVNLVNGGEEEETPKPAKASKKAPVEDDEEIGEETESRDAHSSHQDARRGTEMENADDSSDEEETEPENDEDDEDCPYFGKKCGYDDDVCDECDRWRECRKATDTYLREKRSR